MAISKDNRTMSPRNVNITNKSFKDTQVLFGATNHEMLKGENLSSIDEGQPSKVFN